MMQGSEDRTTLPLAGIKILNAARLLPGGYCATLLSDLGADIIKLEHPVGGDPERLLTNLFPVTNRGNRSITIDLSKDKGKEICYKIVRQSHIFLESFRPGVAKRLGIDYETLKGINPQIIYASISGFGQEGPYRNKPAHDLIYQGIAGMLAGGISEEDGSFHPPTVPIADLSSGMFAVMSILAALYNSRESGSGQYIDVSMTDGLISWTGTRLVPNQPFSYPHGATNTIYQTKDGKYLAIGIAYEQHFWRNLCRIINREELSELSGEDRQKMQKELATILEGAFRSKTRDEWIQILTSADVPNGPVHMSPEEVLGDPQLQYRGMQEEAVDEEGRKITRISSPFKPFGLPVRAGGRPPRLGEHTEEILHSLGYDQGEIAEMKKAGVI
jgi:crotonobetainyl-CoA:carnitine CoA-transferase CaiB-like acyl-CoA transferase